MRVYLNVSLVNLSSFRSSRLRLRLGSASNKQLSVIDASSGKATQLLTLHGPWNELFDERQEQSASLANSSYGLDRRTLTALFELPQPLEGIASVAGVYSWDSKGVNVIESVQIDYLSSTDER